MERGQGAEGEGAGGEGRGVMPGSASGGRGRRGGVKVESPFVVASLGPHCYAFWAPLYALWVPLFLSTILNLGPCYAFGVPSLRTLAPPVTDFVHLLRALPSPPLVCLVHLSYSTVERMICVPASLDPSVGLMFLLTQS